MARALSPARPGPAARPDRDTGQAARPDRDSGPAVALHGVTKVYRPGRGTLTALRGVHLTFPRGSCTAVMGASGSGKTTLLQCAAGLDRPTSGTVRLAGQDLGALRESQVTRLRRDRVGFVFQSFNLVPSLTVELNVALPARLAGRRCRRPEIRDALGAVGLADRAGCRPSELSGGQQQRVAIARALITGPEVIFADEPTGALDSGTGRQVLALLRGLVDDAGRTVIMVTHDPVAAACADRVIFLADGQVRGELHNPGPRQVAERLTDLEMPTGRDMLTDLEMPTGRDMLTDLERPTGRDMLTGRERLTGRDMRTSREARAAQP